MHRRRFATLTLACHVLLAVAIAIHARLTGRSAGRWPVATIGLGVFGVAGYALQNREDD